MASVQPEFGTARAAFRNRRVRRVQGEFGSNVPDYQTGWQLVNWLTHASGATKADAILALQLTQHVLGTFGTALFRHGRGIPDRCPTCGSYKIGLRSHPEEVGAEPVPGCEVCGWIKEAAGNGGR